MKKLTPSRYRKGVNQREQNKFSAEAAQAIHGGTYNGACWRKRTRQAPLPKQPEGVVIPSGRTVCRAMRRTGPLSNTGNKPVDHGFHQL